MAFRIINFLNLLLYISLLCKSIDVWHCRRWHNSYSSTQLHYDPLRLPTFLSILCYCTRLSPNNCIQMYKRMVNWISKVFFYMFKYLLSFFSLVLSLFNVYKCVYSVCSNWFSLFFCFCFLIAHLFLHDLICFVLW